jgi:hypothetical protein
MYWLAREYTRDDLAALPGGVLFMFSGKKALVDAGKRWPSFCRRPCHKQAVNALHVSC